MLLVGSARADTPRTLVYRFSVDPIPLRTGTIRVTIEQPRPDGRQNAVVDEGIDKAARASTTLHCTIYGATTEIDCVPMAEATGEELSVLEFLGASSITRGAWTLTGIGAPRHASGMTKS